MIKALWAVMFLLLIGVVIAFTTWGVPSPSRQVERIISNEGLPQ